MICSFAPFRGNCSCRPASRGAPMNSRTILPLIALLLSLAVAPFAMAEPKLLITPNKAAAVYELGEEVSWKIEAKDGDKQVAGELAFTVKRGGLTTKSEGKE